MIIERCQWRIGNDYGCWPTNLEVRTTSIPPMMRRRLTDLGRMVMENLYDNLSFLNGQEIPWVISCRHGDSTRMLAMLHELTLGNALSPTDFSLSVHNAIGALFSIATGNKQVQTALAGDKASFDMGLLEAYALQHERGGRVGYVYYDAPLPSPYEDNDDIPLTCISLILGDGRKERAFNQTEVHLRFESTAHTEEVLTINTVNSLLKCLKNHDQNIEISTRGGKFILERLPR